MRNRLFLLSVLICLAFSLAMITLYKDYKYNALDQTSVVRLDKNNSIPYTEFENFLLNNEGEFYFFIYDRDNPNYHYINQQYLEPLLNKLNVSNLQDLIEVDFTNSGFTKQRMKQRYNMDDYVGFVKVTIDGKSRVFSDVLTFNNDIPFSLEDFENWLYQHDIIQKTYHSNN